MTYTYNETQTRDQWRVGVPKRLNFLFLFSEFVYMLILNFSRRAMTKNPTKLGTHHLVAVAVADVRFLLAVAVATVVDDAVELNGLATAPD